jgi:DNA-directed RNA polymerase specialized sigma24 family protein
MDESEAIRRLKRADLSGLEWLVRRHQVKALRAAYHIPRDAQAAQGTVQEAFLRACRHIAGWGIAPRLSHC